MNRGLDNWYQHEAGNDPITETNEPDLVVNKRNVLLVFSCELRISATSAVFRVSGREYNYIT